MKAKPKPKQRTALHMLRVDLIRVMELAIESNKAHGQAETGDTLLWQVALKELKNGAEVIYLNSL